MSPEQERRLEEIRHLLRYPPEDDYQEAAQNLLDMVDELKRKVVPIAELQAHCDEVLHVVRERDSLRAMVDELREDLRVVLKNNHNLGSFLSGDVHDVIAQVRGERDSLRAQAVKLKRVLNRLMWTQDDPEGNIYICTSCGGIEPKHFEGCELVAALASTRPNCTSEAESTVAAKGDGK